MGGSFDLSGLSFLFVFLLSLSLSLSLTSKGFFFTFSFRPADQSAFALPALGVLDFLCRDTHGQGSESAVVIWGLSFGY